MEREAGSPSPCHWHRGNELHLEERSPEESGRHNGEEARSE